MPPTRNELIFGALFLTFMAIAGWTAGGIAWGV
jgi:hypothetical protein